jgi:predicted PurR-regulated permease PerM
MDEPDRPAPDRPAEGPAADGSAAPDPAGAPPSVPAPTASSAVPAETLAWVAVLPPPPFVDSDAPRSAPRFAAISPRVMVLIGAAIVIGLLLWMARDSVRPFVLGLLIVYLLDPPVRWLVRRGVRRTLAIAVVYVVAFVAFIEFLNLTITPLINELVQFVEDFPALAEQFQGQLERLGEVYARLQIPEAIREWIDALIANIGQGGTGAPSLDFSALLPLITGAGSFIGAIFGYLILPVWVFYLLKDRVALTQQFDRSLPPTWRFDVWALLRIVQRVFGQWVRGQLVLGLTVGIATFIGLMILSVVVNPVFGRYAVLLSVIAGILELVPIIGPIIAAVPAVLLAATAGLESVIAALVLYTLVQQVENNFLVPKIQGDATALHPAAVIFAIVIGGALAGLLGAILALPITAAFRDVVRYLFRRLSPDAPGALAASIHDLGLDRHPGIPGAPPGADPAVPGEAAPG